MAKGSRVKRKKASPYLFRGKSNKQNREVVKPLLQSIIMLLSGIIIIIYFSSIPYDFEFLTFVQTLYSNISQSLYFLYAFLIQLLQALLSLLLACLSLLLIIGGFIRLTRVVLIVISRQGLARD